MEPRWECTEPSGLSAVPGSRGAPQAGEAKAASKWTGLEDANSTVHSGWA